MPPDPRIRIAVDPSSTALLVLSRRGLLDRMLANVGLRVTWVESADRRQTAGLLADDEIDFGGAGVLAPIHAQAAGADLVYVAHSPSREERASILTRRDAGLGRVADLAGRRIALSEGSSDELVLAGALADSGLRIGDVARVNLARRAGYAALARGAVDAWVAAEPAVGPGATEVLRGTSRVIGHRAVWFATRRLAERRPDAIEVIQAALREADAWIGAHLDDAAALFAEHVPGDTPGAHWRRRLAHRRPGLEPISSGFVAEQQRVADLLAAHGLIPRGVTVADALLPGAARA
jgi:sulfonate transport system substrate-binding protein